MDHQAKPPVSPMEDAMAGDDSVEEEEETDANESKQPNARKDITYNHGETEHDEESEEGEDEEEESGANRSPMDAEDSFETFPQLDIQEIYEHMLTKERKTEVPVFTKGYLYHRSELVEWMTQISERLAFASLTVHLAVGILDRVLSKQEVHPQRLQLFAAVAIFIAAKHEEKETVVPSVQDLNYFCCKNAFNAQIICKTEVSLLNKLNWELMILLPRHFLEVYLGRGATCIYPEDVLGGNSIAFDKHSLVQRYLQKYSEFFIDLCLQDYNFSSYLPSIVASSALVVARRQMKVEPAWPKRLKQLTGYKLGPLTPCVEHIWSVYQRNFAEGS